MKDTKTVSVSWIIKALTGGRFAEKLQAQTFLDAEKVLFDRISARAALLRLIKEDYNPARPTLDDPAEISEVRCWLLSSLGRLPDEQGEILVVLRQHLDPQYEPSPWARYWALQAVVQRNPPDLLDTCAPIASADPGVLPQMLAVAVLAQAGRQEHQMLIRNTLEADFTKANPDDFKKQWEKLWAVLRALRFVYLPFTFNAVCGLTITSRRLGDVTYEALVALGNVKLDTSQAEKAGLQLVSFITNNRMYQYWDAARVRALNSLGRLKIESTAPLLLEELSDLNPAIAQAAAVALEAVLGPAVAVTRILEALSKSGGPELSQFVRGLREMSDQEAIARELGAASLAQSGTAQESARRLLSEIGGVPAFEKLRSLTRSTERNLTVLDNADQHLRKLFEDTVAEARTGFKVVIFMDVVLFFIGVGLIGLSAWLALHEDKPFSSWATWITGSSGVLATIYGRFIAQPREQVQKSVQFLSGLKAVFLAYLRQLRQTDQAFTLRLFEERPLTAIETGEFNKAIEDVMEKAVKQLNTTTTVSKPGDDTCRINTSLAK